MIAIALCLSVWASVVDARSRTIPNLSCAIIAVCGLALQTTRMLAPRVLETLVPEAAVMASLGEPLACVAWGAGVLVCGVGAELAFRSWTGRTGLGLGDVKLLAAWASVIGRTVVPALAISCLLGAVWAIARRERTFAMGPWITVGTALALLLAAVL